MNYLPWRLKLLIAILPNQVIARLKAGNPLMKISYAFKVFDIEELKLYGAVYSFDIAVITPCPWWNTFMRGPEAFDDFAKPIPRSVLSEASNKFAAVICLEF